MPQLTLKMLQDFADDLANAKPTKADFVDEGYIRLMMESVVPAFDHAGLDTDNHYVRECIIDVCLGEPVPEKEEAIILKEAEAFAKEIAKCML